MENENTKQLKILAEMFDTDKIVTSDQIEQVLEAILKILVRFKKENQALNDDTKTQVESIIEGISKEHDRILASVEKSTQNVKSEATEAVEKALERLKEITKEVLSYKAKDGERGLDADEENIIGRVLEKIVLPEYKETVLDSGEEIVNKINALDISEGNQIDASHIKNLPIGGIRGGSTARNLWQLNDVTLTDPTNDQVLKYDSTLKQWVNSAGGGGGTWGSITGTLSNQTDLQTALNAKQATLVSGTNIKTINGSSLLGSGDISISGVGTGTANTIAYWDTTTSIASLDTATYPSLTELSYVKGLTSTAQTQINGKQPLHVNLTSLAGLSYVSTSFVKMTGAGTFALDTNTYLTSLSGAVLTDQTVGQTIGLTGSRLTKLWATDITVTNAISGSVTGNAETVTNATLTTALTVNTGTVTLTGNVANTSVLTIGAGAVSVSGSNTGDNAVNSLYSGLVSNATHTGDATGATALTVVAINGTNLAGLGTGILKNTTGTGVPSIAIAGDFPTLNQNTTGSAATLTTTRTIWGQNFNGSTNVTGDITLGMGNITMTGSIGATGARATKVWTADLESTNMPTVGGTAILTSLTAPSFTTIELGAGGATDTTLSRVSAGVVAIEGVNIVTTSSTDTLTNKTLTAPKFADLGFIADANGNELIIFDTVASAVNELTLANAATGNNPAWTASGGDTNIGIDWNAKGTGTFNLRGNATQAATLRFYEDTDDGSNYTSFKVGTQAGNVDYTLPTAAPASNGHVLSATTAGVMSWIAPGAGSFIGVRLTQSSGASITANTLTALSFDTETFDTDTMHSGGNPTRITFTTAGYYIVTGVVSTDANASVYSGVRLNGTTYINKEGVGNSGASTANGTTISFIYQFSAADYIELMGTFGTTNTTKSGVDGCYFSAAKIG